MHRRSVSVGFAREPVLRIDLRAGETRTLYLRWHRSEIGFGLIQPVFPVRTGETLFPAEWLVERQGRELVITAFHAGLMVMLAVYALALFWIVKDSAYLGFGVFLLAFALAHVVSSGIALHFLWPRFPGWDRISVFYLVIPALNVSWIVFTRAYLNTRSHLPRLDSVLLVLAIVFPFTMWLRHLGLGRLSLFCTIATLILTLGAGAVRALRGDRAGRYFLLANGLLMASFLVGLLMTAGALPRVVNPDGLTRIGSLLQMTLFAVGLSDRVRLIQQDRDRAATLADTMGRLTRYFPRRLAERILASSEGDGLRTERRQVTILFSDLTGFTDLTDRMAPERISEILNEYLREMMSLIEEHGGTLDKFMGDGLMMFFGAPDDMPPGEQARRAVALAAAMQKRLGELAERWLEQGLDHDIRARIGIHQDFATVGNFGSEALMSYTAIGGAVNLASRLEGRCPPGKVLVSFPVYAATRGTHSFGEVEEVQLKGFARPHRVAVLHLP